MTDKQREFVRAYVEKYKGDCGRAYMSVYKNCRSENAQRCALKLLEKEEIAQMVTEMLKDGKRIASSREIQAQLTKIMRGEVVEAVYEEDEDGESVVQRPVEVHPREMLKAAELLSKVQGVFEESEERMRPPTIIDDI